MSDAPTSTVTLLFTDVEGSTELVERLGDRYAEALDTQRTLLRQAVSSAGGREIDCRGEEFLFAFARARDAVAAALAAQRSLAAHPWPRGRSVRVRIGIHTGEPTLRDDGYLGLDVHRGARICGAAHGGQVLVSDTTRRLAGTSPVGAHSFRDLGEHSLKGLQRPERIFQLVVDDLQTDFPALAAKRARSAFFGSELELAALVRAAGRGSQRLRALVKWRARERGLADLGWRARSRLADVPDGERGRLGALADDLFAAARTVADVDQYLTTIDRKGLARLLKEQRELGVLSKWAARDAASYAKQLAEIEQLYATRDEVAELARAVESALDSAADIDEVRDRVRTFGMRLAQELERARNELGAMSVKLRRTRARGVYRLGPRYVVPYLDDLGVEQRREFETLADAKRFRAAIRVRQLAIPSATAGIRPTAELTAYRPGPDVGGDPGAPGL